MRKVGIIGGLGPETTAHFYLNIVSQCQRIERTHRPDILIRSVPIPYDVEENALLHAKNVEDCLGFLVESAVQLEHAGADFVVMPCNTLHKFAGDIQAAISVPFVSVVNVAADFVEKHGLRSVGLIATGITLKSQFYQKVLEQRGVDYHMPSEFHQAKLAKMIYGLVTGQYGNFQRQELIDVIEDFDAKNLEMVLLACTDLQALIPHHPRIKIIDTMQLLADEVARLICAPMDALPTKGAA
ncbi:MAG: amino acid racemase [Pseudomonadaceae bacterium]|nr:amino acid racemase [Pseudomonadaceae bacterium]